MQGPRAKRVSRNAQFVRIRAAESRLTDAIGDIHGCADQLDQLLGQIEEHRAGRPRRLVFLGDYIDRGPDSARVVATLRQMQTADPENVTCLRGNREQMMIDAIRTGDDHLYQHWLMNGGEAALPSFEAAMPDGMDWETLAWISQLPLTADEAQQYFVHTGFDPRRPAPQNDTKTCLWIRELFLNADTTSASTSSTATRRWCAADLMCAASAPTSIRGAYSAAG